MTSPSIIYRVAGIPRAMPRPRFVGKGVVSIPKGGKADNWLRAMRLGLRSLYAVTWGPEHGPLAVDGMPAWIRTAAVEVEIVFEFPLTVATAKGVRRSRKAKPGDVHTDKPDVDNLAKLALDVMQHEGIIEDDRRIARITASKRWAKSGGMTVQVKPAVEGLASPQSSTAAAVCAEEGVEEGLGSSGIVHMADLTAVPDRPDDWLREALKGQEGPEAARLRAERERGRQRRAQAKQEGEAS